MNAIRPSVLIIDYDEEILIALEQLLEDEGFDTTTAWTGRDAIKAANERAFDLVLVHEYLPDMDSERLMQHLREAAGDVPFVVMQSSPLVRPDARSSGWEGAVAVVCKWPAQIVLESVRTHYRRQKKYSADRGA